MDDTSKPLREALPDMLSVQLMAADIYVTFLKYALNEEREMWKMMLAQELAHIRFVAMLIEDEPAANIYIPEIKIGPFREIYLRTMEAAGESAFERTLWALRLEHAQIDFGLETLAANVVGHMPGTPVYPGPMQEHYQTILEWAERYRGAREIAIQIARIEEHIPQSSSDQSSS